MTASSPIRPYGNIENFQFIRGMVYREIGNEFTVLVDSADSEGFLFKGLLELLFGPGQSEAAAFQSRDDSNFPGVETAGEGRGFFWRYVGSMGRVHERNPSVLFGAPHRRGILRRSLSSAVPENGSEATAGQSGLIEYTDEQQGLLFLAPAVDAARLCLWRKVAGVALHLSDGRLLVCRRPSSGKCAGRLDLSGVTCIRPGEAREEAALRALDWVGVPFSLKCLAETRIADRRLCASLWGGVIPFLFLPAAERAGVLALDRDEMEGIALAEPELLTPALLWSVRSGHLWSA